MICLTFFIFLIQILSSLVILDAEGVPVIGGTDSAKHAFPYVVSLRDQDNFHFCGGVIIAEKFILSAYHCLQRTYYNKVVVVAGTDSKTERKPKYTFNVTQIFHHNRKHWLRTIGSVHDSRHDIMILKLDRKIPLGKKTKIAKLPTKPPSPCGKIAFAGWGDTHKSKDPDVLQKIYVNILPSTVCKEFVGENIGFFEPYEMCTTAGQGKGLCDGDSGTPLIKDGVVIGIALWVNIICADGLPDYFANVYTYVDFIKRHLVAHSSIYRTTTPPSPMIHDVKYLDYA